MITDLWLPILLTAFADYRISRMVAVEEGPFEIFLNLRGFIYERHQKQWVANGLTCPLCISFYVSIPIAILLVIQYQLEWYNFFWLWLSLSGIASFLYKMEK